MRQAYEYSYHALQRPAWRLGLQSLRPVRRVAELGSATTRMLMNAPARADKFLIGLLIAHVICFIFFPSIFYHGISAVLIFASSAVALLYFSAAFRSRASRPLYWRRDRRFPMSRVSRLLVGVLSGLAAYCMAFRVNLLFSVTALMLLTVASRWFDTRTVRRRRGLPRALQRRRAGPSDVRVICQRLLCSRPGVSGGGR